MKHVRRVAIVGVEGSGKTVLLVGLGQLCAQPDAKGYFLTPVNFATANYVAERAECMRGGVWPQANDDDALQRLDWNLRQKRWLRDKPVDVGRLTILDFPGEAYRAAFGVASEEGLSSTLSKAAEALKRHVCEADDLVVLVNLRDAIARADAAACADEAESRRIREAKWITNAILDKALGASDGRPPPRVVIVLTQADSYAETIRACGGAWGVLRKYLPHVAHNYDWLDALEVSAVGRTRLTDDGVAVPDKDFTFKGLEPVVDWIREGLRQKPRPPARREELDMPRPPDEDREAPLPPDEDREMPTPVDDETSWPSFATILYRLAFSVLGVMALGLLLCGHWVLAILQGIALFQTFRAHHDDEDEIWRWALPCPLAVAAAVFGLNEEWIWSGVLYLFSMNCYKE